MGLVLEMCTVEICVVPTLIWGNHVILSQVPLAVCRELLLNKAVSAQMCVFGAIAHFEVCCDCPHVLVWIAALRLLYAN